MIIEIRYWYNCIVLGSPFENFQITEFCSEPASGVVREERPHFPNLPRPS